jgi:hypothetical protein
MKKQRKIFSIIIVITAIFSILVLTRVESFAQTVETTPTPAVSTVSTTQLQPTNSVDIPKTIPEKNVYTLAHMQKTGFKYRVFKFFTAMFGVLISSLAIFFGLKFYKKFMLKNNQKLDNIDYDKSLESPKDFKDAVNLFLDKTDKF